MTVVAIAEDYIVRAATLDDAETATTLFNACHRALTGGDSHTVEDVRRMWQAPGFHLETDTRLVCTPDGRLVGYASVRHAEPHVLVHVWTRVHPDYVDQGISAVLLRWAEGRARQAIPLAPAEARVFMAHGGLSTDEALWAALREAGFEQARRFWDMLIEMDEAPPAPQWPDGLTVRAMVRGQDERAIVHAVRESFRDHWGYIERPFEEEFEQVMHLLDHNADFDPSLWFLALDGNEIAGVCLCSSKTNEDPHKGWVNSLGVRRPWRRQGLGLALLRHAFAEFFRRGTHKVGLGVDAQSLTGATRLYEKAGMHVQRQLHLYEKELRPGVDLSTS